MHQELTAFAVISGTSPITEHRIVMHDDRPIKQRYFSKNPKMQEEIKKHRSRYQAEDSSNGKLCHLDFISRQQQSNEHWVIGPEMLQHAFAYLDDIIVIEIFYRHRPFILALSGP